MSIEQWLREARVSHHAGNIVPSIVPRAHARGVVLNEPAAAAMYVWAMLRWERTLAQVAIESCNVDLAHLERQIDILLKKYEPPAPRRGYREGVRIVQAYDTRSVRALIHRSQAEAEELGHSWCGTEHFLLAALALADDDLLAVFQTYCVDREGLRDTVVRLLTRELNF